MGLNDWVRVVIFLLGSAHLGAIVVVLAVYFTAWLRAPQNQTKLPLHIWTIATSHALLTVGFGFAILNRAGTNLPVASYSILYGMASLIGIYSMITIASKQVGRMRGELS
jgi:hypothetical protein